MRRLILLALCLLHLTVALEAQGPGPDSLSQYRARVTLGDGKAVTGRLLSRSGDSVVIGDSMGAARSFPKTDVGRLQVSDGSRGSVWPSARTGLAIGGGTGLVLGLLVLGAEGGDGFLDLGPAFLAGSAVVGAGVGSAVGFIVGSLFRGEHWVEVEP